jgi:hypothetical protein
VAITEFIEGRHRSGIVCLGTQPSDEQRRLFIERGYYFLEPSLIESDGICAIDSVIISQTAKRHTRIRDDLEKNACRLLDHDCRVYVRAVGGTLIGRGRLSVVNAIQGLGLAAGHLTSTERDQIPNARREREGNPLAPFVDVCDSGLPWIDLVQMISMNPAGPAPNKLLEISAADCDGKPTSLDTEQILLVQRAFPDCGVVHLMQMQDGLSGVIVFRAFAEAGGLNGVWPTLHFVKIGPRKIISTEYENYRDHALAYIPFHLAPRLDPNRCGLGSRQGIIVGDFVDHAESLRNCVSSGRATAALGNLFGRTLRAWHSNARPDDRPIAEGLRSFLPEAMPQSRDALRRSMGSTSSLHDLKEVFLKKCSSKPFLMGTIHGDLNATNVLMRISDAIVIDFERLEENMPVVYDVASLEAALLVDCVGKDTRSTAEWFNCIGPLYELGPKFDRPGDCHPRSESAWFFDCVRQIRLYGRLLERGPNQYAAALAVALVRKSCNDHKFDPRREQRRAAAFVMAERLIHAIARQP